MPSATVIATAPGIVPRPDAMPPYARLERAEWQSGGVLCAASGPGFWWLGLGLNAERLRICAPFPAGKPVTLHWTE